MRIDLVSPRLHRFGLVARVAIMFPRLVVSDELIALEGEVFDAMMDACLMDDREIAARLFKVWIKLPSQRPGAPGFIEGRVAL